MTLCIQLYNFIPQSAIYCHDQTAGSGTEDTEVMGVLQHGNL